jgi:protein XRP2
MRFGCFDFHYDALGAQLKASGMTPYSNFWSHVFNFNKETHPDWSLVPADATAIEALAPLPEVPGLAGVEEALLAVGVDGQPPLCFRTWGERGPVAKSGEGCLVLVPEADEPMARELVQMTAGKAVLVRTNSCALSEPWLAEFLNRADADITDADGGALGFDIAERARVVKALARGKCVGLEFGGAGCVEAVRGVAEAGSPRSPTPANTRSGGTRASRDERREMSVVSMFAWCSSQHRLETISRRRDAVPVRYA